ncbi:MULTISPECIES: DUF2382 domain-containing protein [Arsenicicoccus]|uniref:DUF2382 domain-containing protein n=1 Tax=Arsenicicoccus TaxID=267408 RepID=UPI00257944BC|nr:MULTISPECIES: DUF2382 domain-containing protein [Arsenicicoccus]
MSDQHDLRTERSHEGLGRQESDRQDALATVTRSEEELFVTTRPVESGRVRVSKRVVTEERTITVRREELVVEELPARASLPADHDGVTGAGDRADGEDRDGWGDRDAQGRGNPAKEAALAAGEPHRPQGHRDDDGELQQDAAIEIVLHEEQVVTRVVPIERVRVFVDRVTREQVVEEELAKEVVSIEREDTPRADR